MKKTKIMNHFNKLIKLSLFKNLFFLVIGAFFILKSLDSQINTFQSEDVGAKQLRSIIVEGWEKVAWDIESIPGPPAGIAESKLVDGRPINLGNNSKNKKSMGIRFNFVYQGHNSVVLTPPKDKKIRRPTGQLDSKNQPKYMTVPGIELPGRIDSLSIWALGRGNDVSLEVWLEDWRGETFIGHFGSLNYIGWRPLIVKIPSYFLQKTLFFPQEKSMVLKKLVIRSKPTASLKGSIVVFLDSLKVLSTIRDFYFDGIDMSFDQKETGYKNNQSNYHKKLIEDNQDN